MKELRKRWTRIGKTSSWMLKEKPRAWNWANIQFNPTLDEWELRIWVDGMWGEPLNIKTLREAKAMGRVLAASATNF